MIGSNTLSGLVRLALLTSFVYPAVNAHAESKMLVEDTTFNFGVSPQKSKLSRIFWLKSVGEDTLKIFKVIPGCGCTQMPLDKETIPPGDSAKLEIIFNSGKYTGRVIKHPQIQMTGHFMPQLLTIESFILDEGQESSPVRISPRSLDISQNGAREVAQAKFHLENVSDVELLVEPLETSEGFLQVSLPHRIGAGESVESVMKIDPQSLKRSFAKSLTFAVVPVGGGERTIFTLPVTRTYRVFEDAKGKPASQTSRSAGDGDGY